MELELAAVVWATTVCRNYLRGVHFELVTDSKVVAALIKKEVPKRRENLLVRLFEFDFSVTHRKEPFAPNHTRASEFDTNAILCLAGQLAAPSELAEEAKLPLGLDTLPPEDPENPDFSVLRRKIVEEQRKDPKLSQIIAKLEAAHVVRAELDELTQDDSVLELDQAESEAVADASHEEKVDEATFTAMSQRGSRNAILRKATNTSFV